MQKGKLKQDIKSAAKKDRIYGLKGDEVLIVADAVNVLIVKDKTGNRFPVKKEFVEIKLPSIQNENNYDTN